MPLPTAVGRPHEPHPITSLSVVIPVYNSEDTIGPLVDKTIAVLQPHFARLELVLVNDGSEDASHTRARAAQRAHPDVVRYVRLGRNFGEHNAVMCGLGYATGDCAAIIDDDFQNPPEEILKLVDTLRDGYDVVYSYYAHKAHDVWRNLGSWFNDQVATRMLRKPKGLYLSSFKVLNRFLIDTVCTYHGPYPYLDGLILQSTGAIGRVECAHVSRAAGRSNYTLRRLVRLWLNMFTSFSLLPLRIATIMGFAMSAVGIGLALFFTLSRFVGGIFAKSDIPPGWASLIVTVTLFAGLQMSVLGVLGEYIGRAFLTQNRAPQFVVRDTYGVPDPQDEATGHSTI